MKTWLWLLLVSLILLQSFAVVVDAYQFHPSDAEHISFEDHLHNNGNIPDNSMSATVVDAENPCQHCHHCCHCHGIVGTLISSENSVLLFNNNAIRIVLHQPWPITRRISSLYRPPIA